MSNIPKRLIVIIMTIVQLTGTAAARERCAQSSVRQWIQDWEKVVAEGDTPERLQKAVKTAREAATYPNLYAAQCEQRLNELSAAAKEHLDAKRVRVGVGVVLFFLLAFIVVAFVAIALSSRGPPPDPNARRKRLRRELSELRLENDIEWEKARAQLVPIKFESQGASAFKVRDERLLDALIARQTLNQVLGGGRQIEGNPIATAISAVAEEIENRAADGQDTEALEDVLRQLRGVGEKT